MNRPDEIPRRDPKPMTRDPDPKAPDDRPPRPRRLRRLLLVVAALIVGYPGLVLLARFEAEYRFPNGTGLVRALDWNTGTRIDLRDWASDRLLVRDVEDLCVGDKVILGRTRSSGTFVWSSGDAAVLWPQDPGHRRAWRESGLEVVGRGCVGRFHGWIGAETLLRGQEDWRSPSEGPARP